MTKMTRRSVGLILPGAVLALSLCLGSGSAAAAPPPAPGLSGRAEPRCRGAPTVPAAAPRETAPPNPQRPARRANRAAPFAAARRGGGPAEPAVSALAREWLRGAAREPWATL